MNFKGERIKELRKEKGLSQIQLAAKTGISRSVIGMVESGKQKGGRDFNNAMSKFFDVSIDYLEGNSDKRKSKEGLIDNFIKFLVENGTIEDENNIDPATEELILNMIKSEVKKIKEERNK